MFYLSNQLYWIDLLKKNGNETRLYPCRPLLVRYPLLFKVTYINIVPVLKSQSACATTKNSTILVYTILNGKGFLTGCGLHGYSLVSVLF